MEGMLVLEDGVGEPRPEPAAGERARARVVMA